MEHQRVIIWVTDYKLVQVSQEMLEIFSKDNTDAAYFKGKRRQNKIPFNVDCSIVLRNKNTIRH